MNRLRVREGPNALDQITFCAFYSSECFRFEDEDDYEYEISSKLFKWCTRVSQRHFGGKT